MARMPVLRIADLYNVAGAITLSRLLIACSIPWFTHSRWGLLGVLVFGVLTDMLDGVVARRTGTVSRMGAVADGWVDKVFWVNMAWNLALGGWVNPHWLWLWFTRELVMWWMVPVLTLRYLWGDADPPEANVSGRVTSTAVTVAMIAALVGVPVVLGAASVVAALSGVGAAVGYWRRDRPYSYRREAVV